MLDNVQLWFARNENGEIVTINEVNKENKTKYYCPLCNSEVIPRQGEKNSWCFAHIDRSKCSSESMYHFWIKNKLLQQGDKFKIKSDIEKEYICDEILVEQTYKVGNKEYRPDLTVKTTSGETIYFEMNYSNEKKLEDYLDIWMELNNIVVEVDIKTLISSKSRELPTFKAKYYQGKCFNVKSGEDTIYHDTIGQYKEQLKKNGEYETRKNEIKKLDWFWKDIQKYKMNEVDIEYLYRLITSIHNEQDRLIVIEVLKRNSCQQIKKDTVEFNINSFDRIIRNIEKQENQQIKYNVEVPRLIYDRIYHGIKVNIIGGYNYILYNHINKREVRQEVKNQIIFIKIVRYHTQYDCIGNKIIIRKEIMRRLKNNREYFNKNEIFKINNIIDKLQQDYGDKIQVSLYSRNEDLYIAYDYNKIYSNDKVNINFDVLENVLRDNIKIIRRQRAIKKRINNKNIKEKRRYEIYEQLYDMRIYKKALLSQLKQHHQILNVKPMCNKPYFTIDHQNDMKNIVFLSPQAYQKGDNLEQYDIITILNENTYNTIFDREDITNHVLARYNNTNVFINQKFLAKQFLQDELKKYQDIFHKRINLFYHKSKPLNKKYKNLCKFDFVKCTDILNKINNSQVDLSKLEIKNSNDNYNDMIELQSNIIRKNKYINDFFKLFLYAIKFINNDEINLLLNVKYTGGENSQFNYQPWLINDFIYTLEHLGFTNINNIESKEDWND